MTKAQKRIKIAEVCGWRIIPPSADDQGETVLNPHGNQQPSRRWLPDYFKDLNDMHEAWKVLENQDLQKKFYRILVEIAGSPFDAINASAAQRADAFGLTLGLWTESEVAK